MANILRGVIERRRFRKAYSSLEPGRRKELPPITDFRASMRKLFYENPEKIIRYVEGPLNVYDHLVSDLQLTFDQEGLIALRYKRDGKEWTKTRSIIYSRIQNFLPRWASSNKLDCVEPGAYRLSGFERKKKDGSDELS